MTKKEQKSEWLIISSDGSIVKADNFSWQHNDHDLKIFYEYENSGTREASQPPEHVKMMKDLSLVDYEPAADSGNFRWLPKGFMIKDLMEKYVSKIVRNYGGMQIETPIMYDLKHPHLSSYLKRFPARQYQLLSGLKKYFLRFAACFGQYLVMHDMQISYSQLPLKLYEMTRYSFRREQTGELAGLRRLRVFTMPDMHTLCEDVEQAKNEFYQQYLLSKKWMNDLGVKHVMAIRVVDDFFEKNKDFILKIVKDFGHPVLIEKWEKRFFYFILKFEFNVVDSQHKAAALSTVQIDVENTERFEITYINREGKRQHPLLLHASISGSIDRNLYAILEQQARGLPKKEIPVLPYWLSPVQLRLLPVSEKHVDFCLKLSSNLSCQVRLEIDDRNETLSQKIRQAELNWTPFVIVVGDKESKDNAFSVRERGVTSQKIMDIDKLKKMFVSTQCDRPFEQINWPILLSKQPHFR
ncbi:MAG: Threonine-tRNA ligase [Parcubacteria group bacterium GW2011_GWC2_40_31]|nr:MAG: Threonine-tRNA ligase [Parcubacteria group bacterium GW2011_GWF2_40_10]KKR59974.1 MAG: Threonine-tRNA ligase [Parcubacteria group bacterium GW2011_GWC2_40_31]